MREITFNFEVIGSYPVTFNLDDYLSEEDNWDEMTEEERYNFISDNLEDEAFHQASMECDFSIGSFESYQVDDEEEVWIGN